MKLVLLPFAMAVAVNVSDVGRFQINENAIKEKIIYAVLESKTYIQTLHISFSFFFRKNCSIKSFSTAKISHDFLCFFSGFFFFYYCCGASCFRFIIKIWFAAIAWLLLHFFHDFFFLFFKIYDFYTACGSIHTPTLCKFCCNKCYKLERRVQKKKKKLNKNV